MVLPPVPTRLLPRENEVTRHLGVPSLRYEVESASGGRHSYRLYPADSPNAIVTRSSTFHAYATRWVRTELARVGAHEEEHLRSGGARHSIAVPNATLVLLAEAVEASGVVAELADAHELEALLVRVRDLGARPSVLRALPRVLVGLESPEEPSREVLALLTDLATGAPLEWAVRRDAAAAATR